MEDRIEGYSNLADDYVPKPFVPRELKIRVQTLLDNRKRLREKYKGAGILRPKEIAVSSVDEKFLHRLVELMEANLDSSIFGVEQLSEEIGMSRSQLHRKLTALIDQGPNQFIRSFRLQRAHDLLEQGAASSSEIAYQVGFSSPSYFSKCFHQQYGYSPTRIRKSS